MSEKKQKFPKQFIGPSYNSRVPRFDCQRTVNMYLEMDMSGTTGKNDEPMTLIGMPGLKFIQTIGTGPIRAIYNDTSTNNLYVVSANEVYKISGPDIYTATPVLLGTIQTYTGLVSIADNGIQVVFVDGAQGYYSTIADTSPTLTQITSPNFYPADTVTYQDGYFIFNQSGTGYYFISDLNSVNFLGLNQAGKVGDSDQLQAVICNNRELYLLGKTTTEIWWDSGQSGSTPFARQDGKFAQIGCLSPGTLARMFNTFMWVGTNPQGGAVVYMMENDQPVRVSNHAVEYSIQGLANLYGARAYSWQIEGHYFYALNFYNSTTTWVYDLSTQQWTEQQSLIDGLLGRHRVDCHAMYLTLHIVGDFENGNIYQYDFDTYTDNGEPIVRIRQTPHVSENMNRIFYKTLEIDFSPGVGLASGTTNAVTPRVTLEISNDGGNTWSPPMYASIGKLGEYLIRARWQRLGSSRDRVFRVTCSDPVKFDLLSCMLDVEEGQA